MSNVKCQMSNVKCQMSNVKCQMSKCQMSNVKMSNVKCQMSNVKCQMSNVKCQMSNVKMSNVKCQMSNVKMSICINPERVRSAPSLGGDSHRPRRKEDLTEGLVGLNFISSSSSLGYPHTPCDLPRSAGHCTGKDQ